MKHLYWITPGLLLTAAGCATTQGEQNVQTAQNEELICTMKKRTGSNMRTEVCRTPQEVEAAKRSSGALALWTEPGGGGLNSGRAAVMDSGYAGKGGFWRIGRAGGTRSESDALQASILSPANPEFRCARSRFPFSPPPP